MRTAIAAQNLSYSYGNSRVLQNLSFSVEKRSFFIIIGPNGSGKTTLMKLMAGIVKPQDGQLDVLGRRVGDYARKDLARTIAYVPQMLHLDFPFTVDEIVRMGRSPHLGLLGFEQQKDFEIATRAMAFTGVEYLAHRKLDQLSGGEQQLVFIARAICQDPEVILLDEPTASLDLAHQIQVMDLMEKLKTERGVTVVMVSHDINLAAMYCDRLLLLKAGRMVRHGRPNEVLTFETLEQAYGCRVLVGESPLGQAPQITPVPWKFIKAHNRSE
ncbi:MAG: heme ABC transporter ATP-binding protein [Desulfobacterales bacterium]|nr:MAG: heme ABC transporter ATP-binding protein [Desulfobacterales bacterium]